MAYLWSKDVVDTRSDDGNFWLLIEGKSQPFHLSRLDTYIEIRKRQPHTTY